MAGKEVLWICCMYKLLQTGACFIKHLKLRISVSSIFFFSCDNLVVFQELMKKNQIWILCQNSLTRELKIRIVGFVLKKLFTYFEMLIVPHALQCVGGCFFVFYRI